ncbi:RTA1 like protein-domain-containing protein [Melanogaster broomeanus]|nr:RTA1 like protein-domain-containing protein [Melanogaster broomeanus]
MHASLTSVASSLLGEHCARETVDTDIGPYDYVPTRWVCITFISLFAISTAAHAVQATWFRIWWLFPTAVFCGVSELVGWGARLYSSGDPSALTPFEIQISATIIAPTPLIAVNFIILEFIIKTLGARYSRLSPRMYMVLFLTIDVISLSIQGAGGGIAGTAAEIYII